MLWIEPGSIIYAGIFGGMVGGFLMAWTFRRSHRDTMKLIESYWKSDIKDLKMSIQVLKNNKLSPDSVSKPVSKHSYFNKNKGKF